MDIDSDRNNREREWAARDIKMIYGEFELSCIIPGNNI